jgi:hypothetical protein
MRRDKLKFTHESDETKRTQFLCIPKPLVDPLPADQTQAMRGKRFKFSAQVEGFSMRADTYSGGERQVIVLKHVMRLPFYTYVANNLPRKNPEVEVLDRCTFNSGKWCSELSTGDTFTFVARVSARRDGKLSLEFPSKATKTTKLPETNS